jgi:serine/threonine protein kinase
MLDGAMSAERESTERASWEFAEGAPIADGRTVVKRLGGGSRYEVHLVWDDKLFALAVAKLLRPDQVEDDRALRELRREAEALEKLSHPVLVRGFAAVLEGPHPHVLIEHLEGPSLRRLIRRHGVLQIEQLLPLVLHTAAALHYMHGEGMVHLDVKPDNIIMGVPPRLIDLSVAQPFDRAAGIRGPIGTDAYMAPEQCGSELAPAPIGPASDVFGLGATTYHALVGRVPFARESGARRSPDPLVRFPQLDLLPEPLPRDVPPDLADLVMRSLSHDPAERPTPAEFASALEPTVHEATSRRLKFQARPAPLRWRRRRE